MDGRKIRGSTELEQSQERLITTSGDRSLDVEGSPDICRSWDAGSSVNRGPSISFPEVRMTDGSIGREYMECLTGVPCGNYINVH
ncbi:hypothetical protein N7519_007535 [Penicillium mononematosum]|uniref:uncharacterized protein n=1 Tax=Penicillium mononematosum TaxID=268346 RepID=UPI0025497246|nr:uncharacterized protein N7519_007535 [Penicillium mononematosum]KAJ6186234.1 hypothetical protein N7519_007535 [Penicillium mononematosum]